MVTGIEAAGLALGIFPLVIEGLKSYSNGVGTIKDMWRPQVILKSLIRELGMEKCKFENTLTSLLEGIVSESDLMRLMNDPGFWDTEELQNTLKSRLRPAVVQTYIDAIKDLVTELGALKERFELGNEESDDKRAMKRKWKMIRLVLSKAEYKEQLDRISKINSDLAMLAGQNSVNTAVVQAAAAAKNYKRIRNHAMSLYGVLKEKLQPAAPFCPCSTPHNANLQLEMRNTTFRQKGFGQDVSLRFHVVISFESAAGEGISIFRTWRDLELEPIDDGEERQSVDGEQTGEAYSSSEAEDANFSSHAMPPPPVVVIEGNSRRKKFFSMSNIKSRVKGLLRDDERLSKTASLPELQISVNPSITAPSQKPSLQITRRGTMSTKPKKVSFNVPSTPLVPVASRKHIKRIEHLCLIMKQAEDNQSCLGVIANKSGQYLVWPLVSSFSPESAELISLGSLLTQKKMPKMQDRLILGVQLASTVLQLHKTGWLSENWSNEDIFFNRVASGIQAPDFKKPLVRQSPEMSLPQTQIIQETTKSALIPHDQSLFYLGIVLIEIWYGCLLESLQKDEDGTGSKGTTNYMTAIRLTQQISLDAGAKYGHAVRLCIRGLDHKSESLEMDDFKNEVHMKVVAPLVENLESFCGEDIAQIFPERRKMSASI